MPQDGFTKKDWKLFREKLPEWQEAYMERLCREYIKILSRDENASDRFGRWRSESGEIRKRQGFRWR